MSGSHDQQPRRTGVQPAPGSLPPWLLPVALCGVVPVALALVASLTLLVIWICSGRGSPDPAPIAARQSTSPTAPSPPASQPSGDAAAETTITARSQPAGEPSHNADVEPMTGGPTVLRLPLVPTNYPVKPISMARDYAYDPNNGRLAIIGPWKNAIGFINLDEQNRGGGIKNITYVQLTGEPTEVAHKHTPDGGIFAAGMKDPTGVVLLCAQSMQVLKLLEVESGTPGFPRALVGRDSLYLYSREQHRDSFSRVVVDRGAAFPLGGGSHSVIRRIDLESMELDSLLIPPEIEDSGVVKIGEDLLYYRVDYNSVCVAPGKPYVAYQNGVYSLDGKRLLTELEFNARTFVRGGVLAAGVTEEAVVVGSLNDGRIVASHAFPDDAKTVNARLKDLLNMSLVADLFFDKRRDCVVAGLLQYIVVLPLQSLALPDEPLLLLAEAPPTEAEVGSPYACSLRTVSGNPTATLVAGPKGMVVEDGFVRWTPETAYPGPVDVKVALADGNFDREESWQVKVEKPP